MSINSPLTNSSLQDNNQIGIKRLVSLDLLRGLVMILMTLDHTRSFFSNVDFNPLDLERSHAFLFLTRWVTHLCATSFIFLAGIAAFLSLQRGKTKPELARFLLIRGLWLIFLDLTVVSWAWSFYPGFFMAGVLWVIGWSMIVLALLIRLPTSSIAIFGIALIVGHNLFDGVQAEQFGNFAWIWSFLHERNLFSSGSIIYFLLAYPLIPWVGVMACGYAAGNIFLKTKTQRLRWLLNLGGSAIASFIVIRGINIYGDPVPWAVQSTRIKTILSFVNCHKYPPSLLYILMTLGMTFLLLYLFERKKFPILQPLLTFGRVPLFFYLIHLWSIHFAAVFFALPKYGLKAVALPYLLSSEMPDDYGYDLHHVYILWILMLAILYPLCHWFTAYKSKHKYWWLNFL